MDPTVAVDERVDVIARYYRGGEAAALCMPCKMRWRNQDIIFTELGLRHPTSAGTRMIHVFDMSDGINDYRLEFDAQGLTWTLVSLIAGRK